MKTSARFLLLLSSAITSAFTFRSETIVSTLDNLNSSLPRSTSTSFHRHPSVGIYNQLLWHGFSVSSPTSKNGTTLYTDDDGFQGVEPHSEPNYASAPVVPDFFLPGLSSSYVGSNIVFFDLDKFYWGCSTPDPLGGVESELSVPGWCSLEILAYSPHTSTPIARAHSFYFPKNGAKRMEMLYAGLPTAFKAITRVEFKVDADTPNPVFYIDNVQYNVYEVVDMGTGLGEVIHAQTASEGTRGRAGGQMPLRVAGSGEALDGFGV